MGLILDTNAVSAIVGADPQIVLLLGDGRHHLPVPVIAEYQFGMLGSRDRALLEAGFAKLESNSILLPCDRNTANHYATIRQELRRRGTPIPENDLWIAALARQHSLEVVSRDVHFEAVEGLALRTW